MQVSNDTDPQRKAQRETMVCKVSPACHLSENSWRILRRTFCQVVEDQELV